MMMKKIIYIITDAPFPEGGAATMRKISLAKGFLENGFNVVVLSLGLRNKNIGEEGFFEDIKYKILTSRKHSNNKLINLLSFFLSMIKLAFYIFKNHNRGNQYMVWSNNINFFINIYYFSIAKFLHAFYFIEINENPFFLKRKNSRALNYLHKRILTNSLKLFDEIFVMTFSLKELIKGLNPKSINPIVVQNTVSFKRFDSVNVDASEIKKVITYVGSLSINKEGLDLLLYSFNNIKDKFPEFNIQLVGHYDRLNLVRINKIIYQLHLFNRVQIITNISNDEIPYLLKKSYLLVLTRKPNEQTMFGFPTKVVEYLASQRPILLTPVSDVPIFLCDEISAYIPEDFSINSVSKKMAAALSDSKKAEIIGKTGYEVALKEFNPSIESQKIVNSFNQFSNCKS